MSQSVLYIFFGDKNMSFWGVGGKNDYKPNKKKGKGKEKGEKGKGKEGKRKKGKGKAEGNRKKNGKR